MGNEAYIVGAVRTPTGRKKGSLAAVHGADLGAHAIKSLIERTGVDPGQIDDVVFGCVDQVDRWPATLRAPVGSRGPAGACSRYHRRPAMRLIAAGRALCGAGRHERNAGPGGCRRRADHEPGSAWGGDGRRRAFGHPDPFSGSLGWRERYGTQEVSQFRAAEMIAAKWNITRRQMEEFALESTAARSRPFGAVSSRAKQPHQRPGAG